MDLPLSSPHSSAAHKYPRCPSRSKRTEQWNRRACAARPATSNGPITRGGLKSPQARTVGQPFSKTLLLARQIRTRPCPPLTVTTHLKIQARRVPQNLQRVRIAAKLQANMFSVVHTRNKPARISVNFGLYLASASTSDTGSSNPSRSANESMRTAFPARSGLLVLAQRTEKQLPGVGTTSSCELLSRVAFAGMNLRLAGLLVRSLYLKPVRRRLALRDVIIGNGADNKRPSVSEH
jgi:hypothetical protein